MKPDFSEFTYGFALTTELLERYALRQLGVPLFPSLTDEGKKGGGFDVKLPGVPIFMQFKVPEYLSRASAKEFDVFKSPYYRMRLRAASYSKQHQLLLDLENEDKEVYYAAPEFHLPDDLNQAFVDSEVEAKTWFFLPSNIGPLPDEKEHYVVFTPGATTAYFCSEPRAFERAASSSIFQHRLPARLDSHRYPETWAQLADQLLGIYERRAQVFAQLGPLRSLQDRQRTPHFVSYLAQTLFDCHVLIFGPPH